MIAAGGSGPTPVLPYDAEVQYLQSDGTAYINTGVKSNGGTTIKIYLQDYFSSAYAGKWCFGGRVAYENAVFGMYINANSSDVYFEYGNAHIQLLKYSKFPSSSTVEINNGTIKIGTYTGSFTPRTFSSNIDVMLFGLNNNDTPIVYGVKIGPTTISDGTTTLDLIPVRKDGVGYMYDKNSGQLIGNSASSGAFVLGPDVQ